MSPNQLEKAGRSAAGFVGIPTCALCDSLLRSLLLEQPFVSIGLSLAEDEPEVLRLTTAISQPETRRRQPAIR